MIIPTPQAHRLTNGATIHIATHQPPNHQPGDRIRTRTRSTRTGRPAIITGITTLTRHDHRTTHDIRREGWTDHTTYIADWICDRSPPWRRHREAERHRHHTGDWEPDDTRNITPQDWWDEWHRRWAHQPIWLITLTPDRTPLIRYLHRDPARGYTTSLKLAATGEPEPVSDQDLERYARHAQKRRPRRRPHPRAA